jgi:MFS family permease
MKLLVFLAMERTNYLTFFIPPFIPPFFFQFKLGPMQLGLLFLITSVSSAISSPFWGWLVSKYNHGTLMMIIGLSVTAVGLLLLGPSPILPHMPKYLNSIGFSSCFEKLIDFISP